jgi:beta-N-acetylhexosaminidase
MIGLKGNAFNDGDCQLIQSIVPGGIFYQAENVVSPTQLRQFSNDIQHCAETHGQLPLFLSMDHEGDIIDNFLEGATTFPGALAQGASANPANAYQVALAAGKELAFAGINMNLGPVADVLTDYDNRVISQRTFGGTAAPVSEFVTQAVLGYRQAGLIPVIKHFPGHGGINGDSHNMLHVDPIDLKGLENNYLPPFRSGILAGAPVVMVNHIAYATITGNDSIPASQSPAIIKMLRQELGFNGLAISDAMDMKGIAASEDDVPEAAVRAAAAGLDMLLLPSPAPAQATQQRLLQAVQKNELSQERVDEAVRHILTVKVAYHLNTFPLASTSEPDWKSDAGLASAVARQSVAILKNDKNLVPIPTSVKSILIVGPDLPWDFYHGLEQALSPRHIKIETVLYSVPHKNDRDERKRLEAVPSKAASFDLVMLLTWNSHMNYLSKNQWQVNTINKLITNGRSVMVVAVKSPTDILDFPTVPTYLITNGTIPGQVQGLIDTLAGSWKPMGINPLPGLVKP